MHAGPQHGDWTDRDGALGAVWVSVRPPFVARRRHLAALAWHLEAVRDGRGAPVLVEGEAGIGKTRLIEELAHDARLRQVPLYWGRAAQGEGMPAFWPWLELLRAAVDHPSPGVAALDPALNPELAEVVRLLASEPRATAPSAGRPAPDPAAARF